VASPSRAEQRATKLYVPAQAGKQTKNNKTNQIKISINMKEIQVQRQKLTIDKIVMNECPQGNLSMYPMSIDEQIAAKGGNNPIVRWLIERGLILLGGFVDIVTLGGLLAKGEYANDSYGNDFRETLESLPPGSVLKADSLFFPDGTRVYGLEYGAGGGN
jgi:hypothetical protein